MYETALFLCLRKIANLGRLLASWRVNKMQKVSKDNSRVKYFLVN